MYVGPVRSAMIGFAERQLHYGGSIEAGTWLAPWCGPSHRNSLCMCMYFGLGEGGQLLCKRMRAIVWC